MEKIKTMHFDINKIKYDDRGLVPCICQDYKTNEVLMLAYMNRESLKITLKDNLACYYSRSRQELWKKGATSGHMQKIRELYYDCDKDTLLIKVEQTGNACHTGAYSCFFNKVELTREINSRVELSGNIDSNLDKRNFDTELKLEAADGEKLCKSCQKNKLEGKANIGEPDILEKLYLLISDRKENKKEGSYTNYLFDKGLDKILKKVGEECSETIIAAKNNINKDLISETADLIYHMMVMLINQGISLEEIKSELKNRYK